MSQAKPTDRLCTRFSVSTRKRCRRDRAEWPPGYDDLPVIHACRSHLDDDEWAMCLEARRRRDEELRQRNEEEQAAGHAAGIPDQVYLLPAPEESRSCIGQCTSMEQAGLSTTDSASMICANCDSYLCSSCGQVPVPGILIACGCNAEYDDYDVYEDPAPLDQIDHGPDPHGRLARLVHQIATTTGSPHREVNARINREIGVRTRVGASETTIRRASAVAGAWWARVEHHQRTS